MTPSYLFQLGTNQALSLAELTSVFRHAKVEWFHRTAQVTPQSPFADPQKLLNNLGGTIRILAIIPQSFKSPEEALDSLASILQALHENKKDRIIFSAGFLSPASNTLREALLHVGRETKHALKEQGFSVRYASLKSGEYQLSPASVYHNKLATTGYEILFYEQNNAWFAARTVAVQDIESYSFRDEFRPFRDKRLGMIPLKTAQTLLNLAGTERGTRILDPFCGLGTILTEGLMMQAQVAGSDIAPDVIERCKKNLEWYKSKLTPRGSFALQIGDVRRIRELWQKPFDAIVTEGYLGEPMRGRTIHENMMQKTFDEATLLLTALFEQARNGILKPGGRIVICAPYFQAKNGPSFGPYIDRLQALGYTQHALLQDFEAVPSFEASRGTILYARPEAAIGREISVWTLNS